MLDVKVKIDLTKPAGKVGFGIPLIIEENATKAIAYTECMTIADVVAAGFATTSKVYKAVVTMLMQENAPNKFAVCATSGTVKEWISDVANTGKGWRQLVVVSESDVAVADIMSTIEHIDNKMYFADVDVESEEAFEVNGITRTILFYHKATSEYPSAAAALVGFASGINAGSFTYKNIILKGIAPMNLTSVQIEAIHAKGGITFVTKAGDNVTTEGKVAGGEYADIIDSKDYVISNLEYSTQKLLNSMDKIPYDNNGIAILESAAISVLKDSYNNGIIATNEDGSPAYTVNYAMRENTTSEDRIERKYLGGQFAFTLAGAIHTVEVTGEVIV